MQLKYDYSYLNSLIIKYFGKRYCFAKAMGISEHSLSYKMNNRQNWKQPEITKACMLLHIPDNDIGLYFFTRIVQDH